MFLFLMCEPGSKMTNEYEMFGDEIDQCNWYLLPTHMQQMYLIFLSDTQNDVEICSYGNITCNRETSKRVFIIRLRQLYLTKNTYFGTQSIIFPLFSDSQQSIFIFYDFS